MGRVGGLGSAMRGAALAAALAFGSAPPALAADAPAHPLDALTAGEIERAVAILRGAGKVSERTRYPIITLLENAKASVLAWRPGQPFERRARVTFVEGNRLFEAKVDLSAGRLEQLTEIRDRQPMILFEEFLGASEVAKKDARWQAAMRKRGYTQFDNIICAPLTVGPVVDARYRGLRLLNVPCFDKAGGTNHIYGRPIENLLAVVDVRAGPGCRARPGRGAQLRL